MDYDAYGKLMEDHNKLKEEYVKLSGMLAESRDELERMTRFVMSGEDPETTEALTEIDTHLSKVDEWISVITSRQDRMLKRIEHLENINQRAMDWTPFINTTQEQINQMQEQIGQLMAEVSILKQGQNEPK